jgi:cytoskeleton protein RodZ
LKKGYSMSNIPPSPSPSPSQVDLLTAGEVIRQARELAGVKIAVVASALKVTEQKIEALEANRFDLFPNPVFYRSLAASICKYLQIDAAPVLERLPKNNVPQLGNGVSGISGINQPFRSRGDAWNFAIPPFLGNSTTWIVLALVVASIVILLLPEQKVAWITHWIHQSPSATAPTEEVADDKPADEQVVTSEIVVPPTSTSFATSPIVSSPPASSASASATPSAPASNPVMGMAGGGLGNDLIRFKAKGSVWIQVIDANGKTQLSKALVAGDIATASGATPLAVVVGRADAVDVEVRGTPFNLTSVAKENIAKFEVK